VATTSTRTSRTPSCVYFHTDRRLHAYELETRQRRFRTDIASAVTGTPLLAGGVLHLADAASSLRGLDAETGTPLWSLALDQYDRRHDADAEDEFTERATPFTLTTAPSTCAPPTPSSHSPEGLHADPAVQALAPGRGLAGKLSQRTEE
jgi:hypothetical protein